MCHVLIIEDEPLIAFDLQELFEAEGATSVTIVETQSEAVAAAREHRPDVISSDVTLRAGSGPGAVEDILREHGSIGVMFITATPEICTMSLDTIRLLGKPLRHTAIAAAFHELAPPKAGNGQG